MATVIDIPFPKPHPAQAQVIREARRFNVLDCGRRWGKDVLLTRRATKRAAMGERVGWFEPTYKSLSENWRNMASLLYPLTKTKSEQEKRLDLITGGVIEFWSLDNPDSPRGRQYNHVAINEAAAVHNLEYAWTMVIRPTLADCQGSADFASTPRGLNYFYHLWQQAGDNPEWAHWRFSTHSNPHIPEHEIDAMKSELPERVFSQEIMAEFIADGAYFQGIDKVAIIEHPEEPEQHAEHYLVMGVDWALSNDFTSLSVGCRDCNRIVDWEWFNNLDFTYQRERLVSMANRWHVSGVLPERNSIGEPNIEMLRERVPIMAGPDKQLGYSMTATSKPPLIQELANAMEHSGFLVPKDYGDELRAYEVTMSIRDHPQFSAPQGSHDDRVISLALCWWAMTAHTWWIT